MTLRSQFPRKNDHVFFHEIEGQTYIFDAVSGSLAKISREAITILELCTGYYNIPQILARLQGQCQGLTEEDIYAFLQGMESRKFIHFFTRDPERRRRVLLVNPPFPFAHVRYQTNYYSPPLGLLSLAASLENDGYLVEILDMAILDMRPAGIIAYLEQLEVKPDVIGISANMTFTYPNVARIAQNIKDVCPEVQLVLGGNHATFCYEEILQNNPAVDYVVLYEGEQTIVELCDILLKNTGTIAECAGVAYREVHNQIKKNPEREKIKNIDDVPFPAYHLINLELYNPAMRGLLMTSRGCPHNCIYCSTAEFNGRKVSSKSIERIIEDVKRLVLVYGVKQITFGDDAFTINKERTLEICQRLRDEKLDIRWTCNTRVDMVDQEILQALHDAGCCSILYGIESVNQQVLDTVSKRFNVEQVQNALRWTRELGIGVKQNYIIGLPYETEESLQEMRKFINSTNPEELEFCILCLFPGTKIQKEPQSYGITDLKPSWDKYQLILPGIETCWLNNEQIMKNYILSWLNI